MRALTGPNRRIITELRAELQQRMQDDVDRGVEQGVFTTPYAKEAVRGVAVMCIATGQWFSADGPLTPEEVATHCVSLALDTVRAVRDWHHAGVA